MISEDQSRTRVRQLADSFQAARLEGSRVVVVLLLSIRKRIKRHRFDRSIGSFKKLTNKQTTCTKPKAKVNQLIATIRTQEELRFQCDRFYIYIPCDIPAWTADDIKYIRQADIQYPINPQ